MMESIKTINNDNFSVTRFLGLYNTFKEFISHNNNEYFYPNLARLLRDHKISEKETLDLLSNTLKKISEKEEYTTEEYEEYFQELKADIQNIYHEDNEPYLLQKFVDDLVQHGFTDIQSKVIVETIEGLLEQNHLILEGDLETKKQIDDLIKKSQKPYALISEYLQEKYNIIKHMETTEPYILQKNGGFKPLTRVGMHIILSNEWPQKFSIEHGDKIIGYFERYEYPNENMIQFKNCYLDLETMETCPLTDMIFTQRQIELNYKPDTESVILEEELKEMLKENYDLFLQMIGYSFTSHHKDEKLFFLIGERGTGKSTLGKILTQIFGIFNVSNIPLQNIAQNDFQSANIIGKTMNIVDDTNLGKISNVGLLNSISSGSPMSFNPKYKRTIHVTGSSLPKLLILGNSVPIIDDPAGAIYERIVMMRTHKKFRATDNCDTDFIDRLTFKDYEWLIHESIQKYKELSWPNEVNEIEKAYKLESDPYSVIMEEMYEITYDVDNDEIIQSELLRTLNGRIEHYKENGKIIKIPRLTVRKLNELLGQRGVEKVRRWRLVDDGAEDEKRNVYVYLGIKEKDFY